MNTVVFNPFPRWAIDYKLIMNKQYSPEEVPNWSDANECNCCNWMVKIAELIVFTD